MGNGEMMANMVLEMPINRFVTMTAGKFTEEMAQCLVNVLNDENASKNFKYSE